MNGGSTRPLSVISPVMATSCLTAMPVMVDTIAVAIATPAEGPSFGVAPSGRELLIPRPPAPPEKGVIVAQDGTDSPVHEENPFLSNACAVGRAKLCHLVHKG